MKKTTFRLQPRFQTPLENGENHDNNVGNNENEEDDTLSILSAGGWKKMRRIVRKQSETKDKRMRRRQNVERNIFLKTLGFAKVLLVSLCIILMIRYQTNLTNTSNYGGEVVEDEFASSLRNDSRRDGEGRLIIRENNNQIITGGAEIEAQTISRGAKKPRHYLKPNPSLQIPPTIDVHYADIMSRQKPDDTSVPVFWHILKSGGTSVKDMYGR